MSSSIFPGKRGPAQWSGRDRDRYWAAVAAGYEHDEPCPSCKGMGEHEQTCRYWREPERPTPPLLAALQAALDNARADRRNHP